MPVFQWPWVCAVCGRLGSRTRYSSQIFISDMVDNFSGWGVCMCVCVHVWVPVHMCCVCVCMCVWTPAVSNPSPASYAEQMLNALWIWAKMVSTDYSSCNWMQINTFSHGGTNKCHLKEEDIWSGGGAEGAGRHPAMFQSGLSVAGCHLTSPGQHVAVTRCLALRSSQRITK